MNSMVRERESHVSRLFIEVTPGIRRALELLAEASITLLDEIDAPVDGLEADEDFEITHEDDEEGGDHEPNVGWSTDGCIFGGDDEREPNLGWTCDGDGTGDDADEDLVAVETSGGFPQRATRDRAVVAKAREAFDPRLALRPSPTPREWIEHPNGLRFAPGVWISPQVPRFPHDRPDRAPFLVSDEIRRLNRELWPKVAKRNKGRRKGG